MPSVTRSSAPSTPVSKQPVTSAPQSTPRQPPRCKTCHLPRKGHPRQGCNVDSPEGASPSSPQVAEDIEDDFKYLHIEADVKIREPRRPRRSSVKPTPLTQPSLASLGSDSSEILNGLLQPGMMDSNLDVDEEDRRAHAERMKNINVVAGTPGPKSGRKSAVRMPGTLITPSVQSMQSNEATHASLLSDDLDRKPTILMPGAFMTTTSTPQKPTDNSSYEYIIEKYEPESPVSTQPNSRPLSRASSTSSTNTAKPLMKTMSWEERGSFLDELCRNSRAPPASVFTLPMSEIYSVEQSALKRRFHCRVVDLKNSSGDGWLILGMDKDAVEALFAGLQGGILKTPEPKVGGGGFRAVAGGAVAGAVATWGGLAFA